MIARPAHEAIAAAEAARAARFEAEQERRLARIRALAKAARKGEEPPAPEDLAPLPLPVPSLDRDGHELSAEQVIRRGRHHWQPACSCGWATEQVFVTSTGASMAWERHLAPQEAMTTHEAIDPPALAGGGHQA